MSAAAGPDLPAVAEPACGQHRPAEAASGQLAAGLGAGEGAGAAALLRVAVRELCEFTAKAGDLDLRFTPSPTAQEGIAGHAVVVGRRGAGYLAEVPLRGRYQELLVSGRADGYDPEAGVLEEIKTHRGDLARLPDNHRRLHWAQLRIYGWLLCAERGLAGITLALVYFDIASQRETVFREQADAATLRVFFDEHCHRFIAWARQEAAHRAGRDAALAALRFPHAEFRPGQRALAEAAYRAARDGRCLMAEATTGIGKTLGTLFPLLKAMPTQKLDRLFFLSAKTPGRQLALDALDQLGAQWSTSRPRVLEHIARDKACEHADKACHGDSCPLARGFYDRLPAAREVALRTARLDRATLRQLAAAHRLCPYYLAQELCRWADVVVCDYNYYFDAGALLHGLAQLREWRVALLVDEAHNLIERGRAMYSAVLEPRDFDLARKLAPTTLKTPLRQLQRQWNALAREHAGAGHSVLAQPPAQLLDALQQTVAAVGEQLAEQPEGIAPELLRFHFDMLRFCRLAEDFGEHSFFDLEPHPAPRGRVQARVGLRNLLPAPFLGPRLRGAHCAVLFSATLQPAHYHADLLGLPADHARVEVESPFRAEQLELRVIADLSTRYRHRQRSLPGLVGLMAAQFGRRPGNYLAFFSSHDYLRQAHEAFAAAWPRIPTWAQAPGMDEAARSAFLARFREGGHGIGFAVLGGAFGEGIDLPGERLVGAFIATLGLPQINPLNEEMRRRLQALFGAGYDYAYLYPGLQKVVQAAGRVIRTPQDRGCVHLIDDRYWQPEVRRLLPAWWKVARCRAAEVGRLALPDAGCAPGG